VFRVKAADAGLKAADVNFTQKHKEKYRRRKDLFAPLLS
jgi:hypothetical protein